MVETEFVRSILESFWKLIIILDPFLGLAIFITLTKGMTPKERAKQAFVAVSVALGLMLFFLFFGEVVLNLLGLSLSSLRVSGGILLLILGIQAVLGIEFGRKKNTHTSAAAVIIGTPLLCGPGAITTTIILSNSFGKLPVMIAILLAIIVTWLFLYFSEQLSKLMGERVVEVVSRVFGLILAAIAADMIKNGIIEMIKAFK